MAIFNKSNSMAKEANSTTIISKGAKIQGELNLTAKLHIEGECEGKINSSNIISIGKGGVIKGDLIASKLIINGEFNGKAECENIEIMNGGILKGDIIIKNLIIENGGVFEGNSTLKNEKKDIKENVSSKNS